MSTVVSDAINKSDQSFAAQRLRRKIGTHTARVGVLGLGYVGLPLAMAFEYAGFQVVGIDLNLERVDSLKRGASFGYMPFFPGPGLGGHCIPIDPLYLQWKARLDGFELRFIDLADKINQEMPKYVVVQTMELLNDCQKAVRGARVHVLGVTYKKNVNDVRESPALEIITLLRHRGAEVSYTDPFVPSISVDGSILESEPLESALPKCDVALILTDHSQFDVQQIVSGAPLVFDTRNATQGVVAEHVVRL